MIKLGSNNIGKIYLGSSSIGKAYLGSNLVFQKGSGPTPPATTIPYIRGGGGSYINTGITADNTTRVIVWARNFNPGGGHIFGSRIAISDGVFGLLAPSAASTGSIRYDFGSQQGYVYDAFTSMSGYHKYDYNAGTLYIDDTQVGVSTGLLSSDNGLNIYLFGLNSNGVFAGSSSVDICACKIYKNNTLVRDFTAVNSPSIGLYDAISGTVFTNAGSGSFTYGTFNPNVYTPLEYIAAEGSQYFTTPVTGTYSIPATVIFRPTGTVAAFYRVIGVRSNSKIFEVATGNSTYRNGRLYLTLGSSASTAYSGTSQDYFKDKTIVATKEDNILKAYYNHAQVGNTITGTTDTSFDTVAPVMVGKSNGITEEAFVGRIYYVQLGTLNLVPAKRGNKVGMYDTLNERFYESETSTPFIEGPEV